MARRFRFRLDVVERLRRSARDAQQRVVADAALSVSLARGWESSRISDLHCSFEEARAVQAGARVDVAHLRASELYRGWLRRSIESASAQVLERASVLEQERAKLADASKRVKVIEKLRERQWRRYVQELKREEQATNDEAAAQSYMRSVRPSAIKGSA